MYNTNLSLSKIYIYKNGVVDIGVAIKISSGSRELLIRPV